MKITEKICNFLYFRKIYLYSDMRRILNWIGVYKLYPCPCCGARTLEELANWEICSHCSWEDEGWVDLGEISGPNWTTIWRNYKSAVLGETVGRIAEEDTVEDTVEAEVLRRRLEYEDICRAIVLQVVKKEKGWEGRVNQMRKFIINYINR